MIVEWIGRWLDARLHLAKFVRRAFNHVFPDHWSFMLGEIALYSFVALIITGTFLALFFNASSANVTYHGSFHELEGVQMSAAFRSVLHLSFDVPAGLLIRQMHHWAALIFIGAIVGHLARIFFTAAYRRPREINWMIGLTMLILALVNGFFGYSLLGDLLSGAGLRIAYAILLSVPVIGPWLAFLLLGGTVPVEATTPHMYALHIFLVPVAIAVLLALHMAIIWRQMHTNYPGPRRSNRTIVGSRLWPSYAAKSVGLFFLVFAGIAALGGLVQIDPVWIYGPYNPVAIVPGAQPDWYLGWVEGAMRLFPGVNVRLGGYLIPEVFFPAVLLPLLVFTTLYLYPFLEKIFVFDREPHHVLRLPYQQPFNTALGCAAFIFLLALLFSGADDVIAVIMKSSVVEIRAILRVVVFAAPAFTWLVVYALCARACRKDEAPAVTALAERAEVAMIETQTSLQQ
jgi:ubiquinol-cytochrome c reductase cytochrome b subunit